MAAKVFRDPLYNYISIDRGKDPWLLEMLDCPEVQRLRRIHQLGVSYLTYPGADHNRLAHSLGVLHLMGQAIEQLGVDDPQVGRGRQPLLAAALVHDVGHGPFSHLFEPCLGIDHEQWSCKIILDRETKVNKILRGVDPDLPKVVAALVNQKNNDYPRWQKNLLSSQLDVDRLDYLRRDSLFTGAGYGHFNWYRILTTFELFGQLDVDRDVVWLEKSALAIEEYIFARYYMYWNVYLHKTTRGFEKLVEAMWRHARQLVAEGTDVALVPSLAAFWAADGPSSAQYLALEEFTVLSQIQQWTSHKGKALSDLARRFLFRQRLASIDAPAGKGELEPDLTKWETALLQLVGKSRQYAPPEMYCLRDDLKAKYSQPYFPEKESSEQSVSTAIRLKIKGEKKPVEISKLLPRLCPVTEKPPKQVRYYIPKELEAKALRLRRSWKWD